MSPEHISQLENLARGLETSTCLEKAVFLYNAVRLVHNVSREQITIKSIADDSNNMLAFVHVWIEVDHEPVDPIKNECQEMIAQAIAAHKIQENNPVLLMAFHALGD